MQRVLITRPEPGATESASRVAEMGHIAIVAPVMRVFNLAVRPPDTLAATVLTSRNAISACPTSVHAHPAFAVGSATARLASEAGFHRVFNADGDANALARLLVSVLSPADGSLFLPTGEGQGTELAEVLRRIGFDIIHSAAYRVENVEILPEAAAANLRSRHLTAAMFFSGQSAQHFVRLLGAADLNEYVRHVEAICISERASVPLRSLPWRQIKVAVKPNQDDMLVLLND